jgi:hypothetical protein
MVAQTPFHSILKLEAKMILLKHRGSISSASNSPMTLASQSKSQSLCIGLHSPTLSVPTPNSVTSFPTSFSFSVSYLVLLTFPCLIYKYSCLRAFAIVFLWLKCSFQVCTHRSLFHYLQVLLKHPLLNKNFQGLLPIIIKLTFPILL